MPDSLTSLRRRIDNKESNIISRKHRLRRRCRRLRSKVLERAVQPSTLLWSFMAGFALGLLRRRRRRRGPVVKVRRDPAPYLKLLARAVVAPAVGRWLVEARTGPE